MPDQKDWIVYILECCDNSLYTGVTLDVARRFTQHAAGTGAKYTRTHGARRIVWTSKVIGRSFAQRRESQIKRLPRKKKLALVQGTYHLEDLPERNP